MSRNRITIKEIAEKANVSIGTVDRVIHNRGRVSTENEQRIKTIIQETGYVPNWHASSLSSRKTTKIAVLMPDLEHENGFWEIPRNGIQKAVVDIQSHTIETHYHYYNRFEPESFLRESEAILNQIEEIDGLLFAPVITTLGREFINRLPEDFPVVLFDSPCPDSKAVCYVGHDSFGSGRLAGRLLTMLSQEKSKLAVIRSSESDYHINERISGLKEYLKDKNNPLELKEFTLNMEKRDLGYNRLLKDFPFDEFDSYFISDASAHFIAEALDIRGLGHSALVGYDLTPSNVRYLEKGVIDFLISQRSESQGYQGIQNLYKILIQKIDVPPEQLMPMDIVTIENLPYFPEST